MISTATVPLRDTSGETAIMNDVMRKARSVILYGSSIALGLVLAKAWLIALAVA